MIELAKVFLKSCLDTIILIYKSQPILLILPILGVLVTIFGKKIIGMAGEHWVKQELKKLDLNKYHIINDVTVRTADNNTHQIDHLVISKEGIFVIETKQYSGYITGTEYDKKWVQNKKYYINNPVHQNYGHMKALEEVLELDESKFIPIVCISGSAKLKVKATKNHVVVIYDLNSTIMSYTKEILPNSEEIYNKVLAINITDKEEKKKHVSEVKKIQKEKAIPKGENICPMCGGTLVERTGKRGKFLGCSNYPKCRFTKNI